MSDAIAKGFTFAQMVRSIFGPVTDEEANTLLWGTTCFPFGIPDRVYQQLQEAHQHGGGTVTGALCWAEQQMHATRDGGEKTANGTAENPATPDTPN